MGARGIYRSVDVSDASVGAWKRAASLIRLADGISPDPTLDCFRVACSSRPTGRIIEAILSLPTTSSDRDAQKERQQNHKRTDKPDQRIFA
jgi:hypothetical protein